jgi:hypothetical protein
MKVIKLDEIAPGMVLAQPVLDARGNLIVPADTPLTAELADRLRARNIDSVTVKTEGQSSGGGNPEEVKARLDRVFSDVAGNELMDALRAAVEAHLVGEQEGSD